MKNQALLIRADASAEIGTGHVMRCMALAQAWREQGGEVNFACATCPEAVAARLEKEDIGISLMRVAPGGTQDIAETIKLAQRKPAELVVVDGYHFGAGYISQLKDVGLKVFEIDDCAPARVWRSDWLLNQNIYARKEMYPQHSEYTRFLLGLRYGLLRREFWRWRGIKRKIRSDRLRILVTLGGGDPENITSRILEGLRGLIGKGLEIVILAGAANPHLKNLQDAVNKLGSAVRLEINVQDISSLMNWADLAITAGGSTCWETAFMGLPSLVFALAENQRYIAEGLDKEGIAINLGKPDNYDWNSFSSTVKDLLPDKDRRFYMSQNGQNVLDGYGIDRVISCLKEQPFWLRKAQVEDCRLLWEWANDAETRANSFSSKPIAWEEHQQWFSSRVNNPSCEIFIGLDHLDQRIGYIRFDIEEAEATISVALGREFRGKGLGQKMISVACDKILNKYAIKRIHAYIRPENSASKRAFLLSDFVEIDSAKIKEYSANHLVLSVKAGE